MAAGGKGARTEVVSVTVSDSMADAMPEVAAALGRLSRQLTEIAECADEAACGPPERVPPVAAALPDGFRPGDRVEVPGEEELRAALPTLDDAIAALSLALEALDACSGRVREQDERLARIRHVTFGYKSERLARKGFYDAVGEAADDTAAADTTAVADADSTAGTDADDPAADAGTTADGDAGDDAPAPATDDADAAGAGGDAAGEPERAWPPKKKKQGKPRRSKGCASHVTENCVEVTLRKRVDEAEIEALRARGLHPVRLDDGSYEEVRLVSMALLVRTAYEVWRVEETGERIAADRAADSKPMANSPLGAGALAELLFWRYALSLPAPRVAHAAVVSGLGITKQTIYRASTQLALSLARLVVLRYLGHVLRSHCVQSDETWLKVREELIADGRQNSVMWLLRTSEAEPGAHPAAVLAHTSTRSADALAAMLAGFEGTLMADGYRGYPRVVRLVAEALRGEDPDAEVRPIVLAGCLQHCRSRFFDAVQALMGCGEWASLTGEQKRRLPAVSMLEAIGRVFEAERGMPRGATREERAEYRRRRVRPLLERVLLKCHRYLGGPEGQLEGYLADALSYTWGQAPMLLAAVDDPDSPLTNSACEREFANFAAIRNASRQVDSSMGAWTLAQWFSVVRTAVLNGADERIYLEYLLERGIPLLREHGDWVWYEVPRGGWGKLELDKLPVPEDTSYLEALMPWSDEYRDYEASWRSRRRDECLEYARLIGEQVARSEEGDAGEAGEQAETETEGADDAA